MPVCIFLLCMSSILDSMLQSAAALCIKGTLTAAAVAVYTDDEGRGCERDDDYCALLKAKKRCLQLHSRQHLSVLTGAVLAAI